MPTQNTISQHPRLPRRTAIQAGAVGLLGLGMNHVEALHSLAATAGNAKPAKARSVIYIFLSGGLAQHDSFDMKPNAADGFWKWGCWWEPPWNWSASLRSCTGSSNCNIQRTNRRPRPITWVPIIFTCLL